MAAASLEPSEPADPYPWTPLLGLALLCALGGLTALRLEPPPPRASVDTPPSEFSAERAESVAARILGDQAPHPVGSAANARVRGRLLEELRGLGLDPQTQDTFATSRWGVSAWVSNVLARIEGEAAEGAIVLLAHYDSREAAPGAGDDMAGVAAILETVRALVREGRPKRSVIVLITDGEEAGLIGAEAFIAEHPWFKDVGVVLNVEGRGDQGPSMMFQTGPGNASLVRRWASTSSRPVGASTFSTIYRYLPNDTDFTPFNDEGIRGLNFAFIRRVAHYHSAADTLENLSQASLQHHGENLLGLTRDLAWGPPLEGSGDAVYFDLFGAFVVGWVEGQSVPLALLAACLAFAPAVLLWRRPRGRRLLTPDRVRLPEFFWGGLAVLLSLGGSAAALFVVGVLTRSATPIPFVADPAWLLLLCWTTATGGVVLAGVALWTRCTFWGSATAVWVSWALGGVALASTLPGLCYLLVVPALVYGVTATLQLRLRREGVAAWSTATALLPLAAAASLFLPTITLVHDALGIGFQAPTAYLMPLLLTAALPLVARREALLPIQALCALALLAAVALGVAVTRAPYSEERPEPVNLVFHQDEQTRRARWIVISPEVRLERRGFLGIGGVTLREAKHVHEGFAKKPTRLLPGTSWLGFVKDAEPIPLQAPELVDLAAQPVSGGRRVTFTLRSRRGATAAAILLPSASVESVRLQGRRPQHQRVRDATRVLWCSALPPGGLRVELVLRGDARVEATVLDATLGVPPAGAALLETVRPRAAAASYMGDQTIASRSVEL